MLKAYISGKITGDQVISLYVDPAYDKVTVETEE